MTGFGASNSNSRPGTSTQSGDGDGGGDDFAHHFFSQSVRLCIAARQWVWSPETCERAVLLAMASLTAEAWNREFRKVLLAANFGEPTYLDCRKFLADITLKAVLRVADEESLATNLGELVAKVRRLEPIRLQALVLRNVKGFGYEEIAARLGLEGAKEARDLFYQAAIELKGLRPAGRASRGGHKD